jgi:RNase P/RNase MRP subunit p29
LLGQSIQWAKKDSTVPVLEKVKEGVSQHMVKADLNGAFLEIVNANNKQLIGIKGIVAKETKRSFVIISEDEK